jgi:CRP-like cAMP-binding protein
LAGGSYFLCQNILLETERIRKFISPIHTLNEKEWMAFSSIWQPFECKRKTILTTAGETERYLYFVLDGVKRAFYIGNERQEPTVVFTYPPSFSGVADSFLTQTPSICFFETLTSSKFLRTTYKQVEELMNEYPGIQKLILRTTSFALKGVLARQIELQCFSAEEKFRTLLKRSPHLLQLIPHKYLASYLGMDATNFSKLMGSVRL